MALSTSWGSSTATNTGFSSYATTTIYRTSAGNYPSGQARLDGSSLTIYAHSISAQASGASHNWSIGGGGGYKSPGSAFQANLNKTGAGTLNFNRNNGAGGTIRNTSDSTTWPGNFVGGSLSYSTAPAPPAAVNVSLSGKKATVTFTAAPNGGGESIQGYSGQYRKDGGSWVGTKNVSSVQALIWDNLEPGEYEFRVYTRTGLFTGAARVSSKFTVKSGGKRKDDGSWVDTATFKRKDGGTFTDILTYKRKDPEDGWVDGGS